MTKANDVVFLDRKTITNSTEIGPLIKPYSWVIYDSTESSQVVERCKNAVAVVTNKVVLTAEQLNQLPNLKYIGVAATGVDSVDLAACRQLGITVANVSAYGTASVAEHTFMLMLMLFRQCLPYQKTLMQGHWQNANQFCYFIDPIKNLEGKKLGLIGTGAIAMRVAQIASVFGMQSEFYSPSGRAQVNDRATVSLTQLLQQSDVVSLHCPLTKNTHQLINQKSIAHMKTSAFLINCARGAVVDIDSLLNALNAGTIAGAALDVLPQEPPATESELFKRACEMGNLILTPHIAWASDEAMQTLADQLLAKLNQFLSGEQVTNLA